MIHNGASKPVKLIERRDAIQEDFDVKTNEGSASAKRKDKSNSHDVAGAHSNKSASRKQSRTRKTDQREPTDDEEKRTKKQKTNHASSRVRSSDLTSFASAACTTTSGVPLITQVSVEEMKTCLGFMKEVFGDAELEWKKVLEQRRVAKSMPSKPRR